MAFEQSIQRMEVEAQRRAVDGTRKPVYYKGVKVGAVQEYSDNLMMFLLKARRPEVYRERVDLGIDSKILELLDRLSQAGQSELDSAKPAHKPTPLEDTE